MSFTFGTLFSGGGGYDIGAIAAGGTPLWGVEYVPDIAAVANANLGGHIRVMDIREANPADFEAVDLLHASPPCPNFSVAKTNREETEIDIAVGQGVVRFIETLKPQWFTLENVWGYRKSESWRLVREALYKNGYWVDVQHVNSADFGVPQTRRRMVVRATRGNFVPALKPTHVGKWVGWYSAVADLIDDLPDAELADWQVRRLNKTKLFEGLALVKGDNSQSNGGIERSKSEPAQTVTGFSAGAKVVMVDGSINSHGVSMTQRGGDEPSHTVATSHNVWDRKMFLLQDQQPNEPNGTQPRAGEQPAITVTTGGKPHVLLINNGSHLNRDNGGLYAEGAQPAPTVTGANSTGARRIVALDGCIVWTKRVNLRCLARFQTFPDWYVFPDKKTLGGKIVGNAVPCLLAQRIVESLVN